MFDFDVPFFRPLWIRLLIVVFTVGWGVLEYLTGSIGFAMIFLTAGLYAGYRLFITFDPERLDEN